MQTAINGLSLLFRIVGLTLKSFKIGNFGYKFIEEANPLNIFFKFAIGESPAPSYQFCPNYVRPSWSLWGKIHTYK